MKLLYKATVIIAKGLLSVMWFAGMGMIAFQIKQEHADQLEQAKNACDGMKITYSYFDKAGQAITKVKCERKRKHAN